MNFTMIHMNINVQNMEKAIKFYQEALGLEIVRQKEYDGFILTYLQDMTHSFELELTWLKDHADRPYELGENETHLAFRTDDFDGAYKHHKEMGCICFENKDMGLYFIEDPDGYWIEIVPVR